MPQSLRRRDKESLKLNGQSSLSTDHEVLTAIIAERDRLLGRRERFDEFTGSYHGRGALAERRL